MNLFTVNYEVQPIFSHPANDILFYELRIYQPDIKWFLNKDILQQLPDQKEKLWQLRREFAGGLRKTSLDEAILSTLTDLSASPQTERDHTLEALPLIVRPGPHIIKFSGLAQSFVNLSRTSSNQGLTSLTQLQSWGKLKETREDFFSSTKENSKKNKKLYANCLTWTHFATTLSIYLLHSLEETKIARRLSGDKINLFKHFDEQTQSITKAVLLDLRSYSSMYVK